MSFFGQSLFSGKELQHTWVLLTTKQKSNLAKASIDLDKTFVFIVTIALLSNRSNLSFINSFCDDLDRVPAARAHDDEAPTLHNLHCKGGKDRSQYLTSLLYMLCNMVINKLCLYLFL